MSEMVSVLMCTFNGARYLNDQLASLCRQTVPPGEIVFSDDGSRDETVQLVREFASTSKIDVRIYANEKNLGYKKNFKRAVRYCRGDYVAFCDQDDIWSARKLELCMNSLSREATGLVVHQAGICDQNGIPTGKFVYDPNAFDDPDPEKIGPWPSALGFTQVFRKSILYSGIMEAVVDHWTGGEIAHDQLVLTTALATSKVVFLKDTLALYRHHDDNVIGSNHNRLRSKIEYLLTNRACDYLNYSRGAASRADAIRKALDANLYLNNHVKENLIVRYELLSKIYGQRSKLYSAKSVYQRASIYRALSHVKAYGDDVWSLPTRQRYRDLTLGVLLAPLLRESAQIDSHIDL